MIVGNGDGNNDRPRPGIIRNFPTNRSKQAQNFLALTMGCKFQECINCENCTRHSNRMIHRLAVLCFLKGYLSMITLTKSWAGIAASCSSPPLFPTLPLFVHTPGNVFLNIQGRISCKLIPIGWNVLIVWTQFEWGAEKHLFQSTRDSEMLVQASEALWWLQATTRRNITPRSYEERPLELGGRSSNAHAFFRFDI